MSVRIGIVGYGGIAGLHQGYLTAGKVTGAELTAVADIDPARLEVARKTLGDKVRRFDSADALIASGTVDGVLICTPHYDHPTIAVKAFQAGLHVLTEKPAGVYTRQVREMNEAAEKSGKVFSIMFNQRTVPVYQKIRDLVQSGELGEMMRFQWTITNWFRTQNYYDSGGWRATWSGEGGGALINQCPHNLDMWQWICGLPKRVRAFCAFGKHHRIEVEDEVSLFVEYENGAVGTFVTSTAEAPGTNRMEIVGDRGTLIFEDSIRFRRNRRSSREVCFDPKSPRFGTPECWDITVPLPTGKPSGHFAITQNWVDVISKGGALIAPGLEGIRSLQISNAAYLSAWEDCWVDLPVDEGRFLTRLQERIKASTFRKEGPGGGAMDFTGTFNS